MRLIIIVPAAIYISLVVGVVFGTVTPQATKAFRRFGRAVLVLYLFLFVIAAFVSFSDPPLAKSSVGTWGGMFGFLASMFAGLPWSALFASTIHGGQDADRNAFFLFWAFALVNVLFLLLVNAWFKHREKFHDSSNV